MRQYKIFFNLFLCQAIVLFNQNIFSGSSQSSTKKQHVVQKNGEPAQEQQESMVKKKVEPNEFKFDFPALVAVDKNLENEIIQQAWLNVDNRQMFLECFFKTNIQSIDTGSTFGKYYEEIAPIHFYTLAQGKPVVKNIGSIIKKTGPTFLDSIGFPTDTNPEITLLFLKGPRNEYYASELSYKKENKLLGACFSVLGDIAIMWESLDNNKKVRLFQLSDIKSSKKIDLESTASNISFEKEKFSDVESLLFNLDATQLGVCFSEPTAFSHITARSKWLKRYAILNEEKPLTFAEKAKRLGIATEGVKKLLQEKKQNLTQ